MSEDQPLIRRSASNEVGSMGFVFGRVAGGRVLTIIDDATHGLVTVDARD